jgi:uncharacterized OB-fold protein
MPYVGSIGTYLPAWGESWCRVAGDDEDAITMAVEAGRAALRGCAAVERVILVTRDLPLTETSNAAVLLAGLGLDQELEVTERLGGAPATLDALSSARPRTMIIGVDVYPAGATAIVTADQGLHVRTIARVARSLPVRTRNALGEVHDYGDARLLHQRGVLASLEATWSDTPIALAGIDHVQAVQLCIGDPPVLPTVGASAGLFALAAIAEIRSVGPLIGVEQASLSGVIVGAGAARIARCEPSARTKPPATMADQGDIPISLAAYSRAFDAKTRWEAGRVRGSSQLDFPPRYHVGEDGSLRTDYELVQLPRTATVYSSVAVHLRVPGLPAPYALVIVQLDDADVRALARVTGSDPSHVDIGDRGRLVLRRIAMRSGVPDYGYAFQPESGAA